MIRGVAKRLQLTTNEFKSDHSATIVTVRKSLNAPKHIAITKFNIPDEKAARKLYDFEIDQEKAKPFKKHLYISRSVSR